MRGAEPAAELAHRRWQHALLRGVPDMPAEEALPHGMIVGAFRITHALTFEQCSPTEPWAFGPIVNVIGAIARIERPVQHRGARSLWPIEPTALDELRR